MPNVLDSEATAQVRSRLLHAAKAYEDSGESTYMPQLDPNDSNVRVFNLLELDPIFRDLILHPLAVEFVAGLLGEHFMISNFTANIALPGSESMVLHSDQSLVAPPPWQTPWSMNIIWCLDDLFAANGATRYLPGSHHFQQFADVPDNAPQQTVAFEAPAGSFVAMDGRMWHTSGANVTQDAERALLFAYYSVDYLRPQANWNVVLSTQTQASVSPELYQRLGLDAVANTRLAGSLFEPRAEN